MKLSALPARLPVTALPVAARKIGSVHESEAVP
jgi:hypothetical protein